MDRSLRGRLDLILRGVCVYVRQDRDGSCFRIPPKAAQGGEKSGEMEKVGALLLTVEASAYSRFIFLTFRLGAQTHIFLL